MKKTYLLLLLVICFLVINTSYAYENKTEDRINMAQKSVYLTENNITLNVVENSINSYNTTPNTNLNTINNANNLNNANNTNTNNTNSINSLNAVSKTKTIITTINENNFYKNKYIQVKLTDKDNNIIPNVDIYMTLDNGKKSKTYKLGTDKNGLVKVEITLNTNYEVLFEFKGNNKYQASSKKISVIKELSLTEIEEASEKLKVKIEKTGRIPKKVKINQINYTIDEFLYLMGKAIINLKNNNKSPIKIKAITTAPEPNTQEVIGKIYSNEIIKITKNLIDFMNSNSRTPNYLTCNFGKLSYSQIIHIYSKILTFEKTEHRICNYVTVVSITKIKESVSSSKITTTNTLTTTELSKYLVETANCQCNNAKIKELSKTLTSSLTSIYQKANAIFKYVRDKIDYENYSNTRSGAVKTLEKKVGNCVDQSHLLIALSRAAKIPARYVHGRNCKFTSGLICGHVWTEILINGKWYAADPTSVKNSLGLIKNWNTNSYTLKGKYNSLSF